MTCPYHHCGVTTSGDATREGHCPCPECHAGAEDGFPASRIILAGGADLSGLPAGKPMCDRWYERAGDYRPWQKRAWQCKCGISPHGLPYQHGEHCPVYRYWHDHQDDHHREPVTS